MTDPRDLNVETGGGGGGGFDPAGSEGANADDSNSSSSSSSSRHDSSRKGAPSSRCPFDVLCDDLVARVASFCEFATAVRFLRCVSGAVRRRVLGCDPDDEGLSSELLPVAKAALARRGGGKASSGGAGGGGVRGVGGGSASFERLWLELYRRHRFSPPDGYGGGNSASSTVGVDYLAECRRRRDLFRNLIGSRTSQSRRKGYGTGRGWGGATSSSPFGSLPNRYFHFLPLTPSIDDPDGGGGGGDDEWDLGFPDDDPPPVEFVCDSYALLSAGTGARVVLMDPFDGSISVRANVLDDAVASEEGMLERAMAGAASAVLRRRANGRTGESSLLSSHDHDHVHDHDHGDDDDDEDSAQAGGAAMEDAILRNHGLVGPATPPEQVLFGVEDYFSIDLGEYFRPGPGHAQGGRPPAVTAGGGGGGATAAAAAAAAAGGGAPRAQQDPVGLAMEVTRHIGGGGNGLDDDGDDTGGGEDEITVDWLGVSCHTAIDAVDGSVLGTMVGAARILTNEGSADRAEDERTCSEVIGWKQRRRGGPGLQGGDDDGGSGRFDVRYASRIAGFPNYMDIDAAHDKVYATFAPGEGPFPEDGDVRTAVAIGGGRGGGGGAVQAWDADMAEDDDDDNDDDDEPQLDDVDWNGNRIRRSRCVIRYPFICVDGGVDNDNDNDGAAKPSAANLFPPPEVALRAARPVSCFAVDPTGRRLLLGTDGGIVEVWDTGTARSSSGAVLANEPRRVQTCDVGAALAAARTSLGAQEEGVAVAHSAGGEDSGIPGCGGCDDSTSMSVEEDAVAFDGQGASEGNRIAGDGDGVEGRDIADALPASSAISQCKPTHRVEGVFLPRHLPVEACGFVTLQHHRSEGTTLGLWQRHTLGGGEGVDGGGDEPFVLAAVINLPLSPQRKPQVSYDGRRLIVFGQDHIGLIVLVYHVLGSREDQDWFEGRGGGGDDDEGGPSSGEGAAAAAAAASSKNARLAAGRAGAGAGTGSRTGRRRVRSGSFGDASGGVINLPLDGGGDDDEEVRVRYANRVRHAGLGGLEYYDPAFMTCNERFVVVNTKTGNLVGGDGGRVRGACEGLFVIDLEERHL